MGIHLPAGAAVSVGVVPSPRLLVPPFLFLDNRNVGIGIGSISGRFPEYEKILRHTHAHLRAVFALLSPAEAVGLIVFPDHIGNDCFHAHVGKAVFGIVPDTVAVERIDRLTTHAAQTHGNDAVFDMDYRHTARLQHSVQIGGEIVHLLKKLLVAL